MRRFLTLFLLTCLVVALTACGGQSPPEAVPDPVDEAPEAEIPEAPESPETPPNSDKSYTVYDCGGIAVALPTKYLDQLIVDTEFSDMPRIWKPLISVYERASAEAAEAEWGDRSGMGFLFGLLTMDRVGLERYLCEDIPGMKIIAEGDERYYAQIFPTDVRFYRPGGAIDTESADWRNWIVLERIAETAAADMIRRNGLTSYDGTEFLGCTWEGVHAYFRFYHRGDDSYDAYGEATRYVLVLSQPVRQGEGGIWCLDRWMYEGGDPMIYFPDSGLPAAEYYARLQMACDGGEHPELLTPAGAAAAFVEDYFGIEPAPEDLQPLDEEEEARAAANLRLRGIVNEIYTGQDVDGMELLECLGRVETDNWASLGLEESWWSALLAALENAAIGEDQQTRDRDMMAFCLTVRGDLSRRYEAVATLVRKQWEADGAAFAAALATFTPEKQTSLQPVLGCV